MNGKTSLQVLFIVMLLSATGISAPSNGVDDAVYKSAKELLLGNFFATILGYNNIVYVSSPCQIQS